MGKWSGALAINTAQEVIDTDLSYISANLKEEFSVLSGKKLLITGGAGFLGYYLVQSVLYWNAQHTDLPPIDLTVFDNYSRGVPEWLTNLKSNPNLTLIKHDITHPLPVDMGNYQYIIHAASIASPTYYRKHPLATMDANVDGLRFLLEYCLQKKETKSPVEGFLFFSTSEIYGDPTPDNIPTPETYRGHVSCTGPRACYDESKRYGETLCVNFAQQYQLPIKMARPFNNYGPGLKITDRRVLPDFAKDVLEGRDIVMLSDGSPSRTFCYVADAIIGYYKILMKGQAGEAYNIGVETPEISMAQLADRVVELARELFDYKGRVVCQESTDKAYMIDNPNRRCPIIKKACAQLGYNPSISVEEGLKRSLIWYHDNRQAEES
jgi:UDP-glucuronate decarboxylase